VSSEQPILAGVAGRYASALFEIALDIESGRGEGLEGLSGDLGSNAIDAVASDLEALAAMLNESEDLRLLVRSPIYGRDEQAAGLLAVLEKAEAKTVTKNFVMLVATNRRLFALEDMIKNFRALVAAHRNELTASVSSATVLSDEHVDALKATLKETLGQDVQLELKVDESLIAGLVVKVGSRMIDSSLKTKLSSLKIAMKEVG